MWVYRVSQRPLRFIRGAAVDGFIRNGNHFLSALHVFADGVFDCWGGVDRDFLQRKVASGWITPRVPDGRTVSVHHTGQFTARDGQWRLTPAQLHQELLDRLDRLNPSGSGLVDFEGSDVTIRNGGARYSKIGMIRGVPVRGTATGQIIRGARRWLLSRRDGVWWLGPAAVYADGLLDVHPLPGESDLISWEELDDRLQAGLISGAPGEGERLHITHLGEVTLSDSRWWMEPAELRVELLDAQRTLCGERSAQQRFARAWRLYFSSPSPERRQRLRLAYEAVPAHMRIYLGDMDTRDTIIQKIVYSETEPSEEALAEAREAHAHLLR